MDPVFFSPLRFPRSETKSGPTSPNPNPNPQRSRKNSQIGEKVLSTKSTRSTQQNTKYRLAPLPLSSQVCMTIRDRSQRRDGSGGDKNNEEEEKICENAIAPCAILRMIMACVVIRMCVLDVAEIRRWAVPREKEGGGEEAPVLDAHSDIFLCHTRLYRWQCCVCTLQARTTYCCTRQRRLCAGLFSPTLGHTWEHILSSGTRDVTNLSKKILDYILASTHTCFFVFPRTDRLS